MVDERLQFGTLWIAKEVLQLPKWQQDKAISTSLIHLTKYKGLDGFLKPSPTRQGDFALIISNPKMPPVVAIFIGLPGQARAAIVEELFVAQ